MIDQKCTTSGWLNEYFARYRIGGTGWTPGRPLDVCFLVGSLAMSGGTYVILEHALHLQRQGATVTLVPVLRTKGEVDLSWHPGLSQVRIAKLDEVSGFVFDVAIATFWATVYELPRLRFRHAMYLVQSIESRFYALDHFGDASSRAELTYRFGLPCVTIARWMQVYLALEYGVPAFLVRNGIQKSRFLIDGPAFSPREPGRIRALVEGTVDASMKGVPEALDACRRAGFSEVWLLTGSKVDSVPGADRVFSHLSVDEVCAVYRSTDVMVKLSRVEGMYGPPLEMFHCGGTVVTWDVTGCEEYVVDGYNGLICPTGDFHTLNSALRRVASDVELVDRLKSGARETATAWPDWDRSSTEFAAYVYAVAAGAPVDLEALCMRINGAPRNLALLDEGRVANGRAWEGSDSPGGDLSMIAGSRPRRPGWPTA